jgi:predicted O-methyltransferase YrrM
LTLPPDVDPPEGTPDDGGPGDPVSDYIERLFAAEDSRLLGIREAMEQEGLPTVQIPPVTARTIQLLLRAIRARRVLEVGTLAGYSALWMSRALPAELERGQGVLTLEEDPDRAALAKKLMDRMGAGERVHIRIGDANELLPDIGPNRTYDAVFLDADKEGLPGYVTHARRLLRIGGLLLVDNALWKGQVVDPTAQDEATVAIRETHRMIAEDPAFDGTILPVGDGLLVALRR